MNSPKYKGIFLLENQIFRNALRLGLLSVFLLIIYDTFYNHHYLSVGLEIFAGVTFYIYLKVFRDKAISTANRNGFSIFLFLIANAGWLTSNGFTLLNSSIYFLVVALILILIDRGRYVLFFLVVISNIILLFVLQKYTTFYDFSLQNHREESLVDDFCIFSGFLFLGSYLIVFLKNNYNKERQTLNEANVQLSLQAEAINSQNEELLASKTKLDTTIEELENQAAELMLVKQSLETKVAERTGDLMKLNDRLTQQNKQLEQYAYITSHNLRAPITQLKGLTSILPDDVAFDELTRETLERIKSSAVSLERVFADLSAILKVEKNKQNPWEKVDLATEIQEVCKSLRGIARDKKVRVAVELPDTLEVLALKAYVYSVFHNIIENAIKYADLDKEDPFVQIKFTEAKGFYHISVTDNGIGIDMDAASGKMFQLYQRFNSTHPGHGFGLYLVKSQMEAMEGRVEVDSILGRGTTFHLYFPVIR